MPSHPQNESLWPHRLAMLLVCATFPLIWIGGLVTTTKSGMAVPDWPSTYGYNMFLYPWQTWVFGPYDLFLEHGHRLLASTVGLFCIVFLVLAIWRKDKTLITLGAVALALVLFQGVLGGLRVVWDKTTIARVHGCVGPLFFGYLIYLECSTSKRFRSMTRIDSPLSGSYLRLSIGFVIVAFLQIVLGSLIRHVPVEMTHGAFRASLLFHVITAFLVMLSSIAFFVLAFRDRQANRSIRFTSAFAVWLIVAQIALGIAAYTVKYGWPTFLPGGVYFADFVVKWESGLQSVIVTGHVAVGSLILACSVMLLAYCMRCYPIAFARTNSSSAGLKNSPGHEVMA
ncbi:COX15/CtaA family protein [Bremerella sp. T1]|uniref:COX15/CtaA family protein n=1 Tax=Bremerella sp. TYQ1 TaxID=3119568 RepID=UPI001CCED6DF|nr:COX15/CtaA family protein [Bremerella volcania]UBM38508.1 COX15/CtaA family protein [Bremerella volcania]